MDPDDCNRAADIYQCFRDKAPVITDIIQDQLNDTTPLAGVRIKSFQIFTSAYVNSTFKANAYPCVPIDTRYCRMEDAPCDVVVSFIFGGYCHIV